MPLCFFLYAANLPAQDYTEEQTLPETPLNEEPTQPNPDTGHVPGELIVKLKAEKTLNDISELNAKYMVISAERFSTNAPEAQETTASASMSQEKPATETASKVVSHDTWYWQLEKDSTELKDYTTRIEKEKESSQTTSPPEEKEIPPAQSDNTYLLKVGPEVDILGMAEEYRSNPNVEYAQPK